MHSYMLNDSSNLNYYSLQVIQCVQKGGHCELPDNCPADQLMFKCWEKSPKKRPTFEAITTALQELISDETNN